MRSKLRWSSLSGTLRGVKMGLALTLVIGCGGQQGQGSKRAKGDLAQAASSEHAGGSAARADEPDGVGVQPGSSDLRPVSGGSHEAAKVALVSADSASPAVQELPTGSKVLQVGDSFAGALGIPLGKMLEARGVHSVLKARDASYLTDWAWDGALQKHIWKYNPDLVVITLGANELKIGEPEARAKTVKKLVSIVGERPCVWIAIPLWDGPQNGLLDVIRKNVGSCRYLDTNALIDTAHMARIEDGIHPTAAAREAWAETVLQWLVAHREPRGATVWSLTN